MATALVRSGLAYSSVTDNLLITSSLKQVIVVHHSKCNTCHIPGKAQVTFFLLLTVLSSDSPNETVNGDSEDPPFFSTTVCCSLVNFA